MELTRAGPICIRYIENAIQLAETWEMTQVRFWLNIAYIDFFYSSEIAQFCHCCFQETQGLDEMQILHCCEG